MANQRSSLKWWKASRLALMEREPPPLLEIFNSYVRCYAGSPEGIWCHRKPGWYYNQYSPKIYQGGFTKLPPPPPLNSVNRQKRAMRCAMRKPQYIQFNISAAQITELNGRAPPKRWTPKSTVIFYSTPSQTFGPDKPTSRDGTLKGIPTRKHSTCLNKW